MLEHILLEVFMN